MQQAEPGRRIVPAETLEKRQCLVRFFTSLASATFLAERKRVSKGTIRRPGFLGTIPHFPKQIPESSLTTSDAIMRPAAEGTNDTLPGIARPCIDK